MKRKRWIVGFLAAVLALLCAAIIAVTWLGVAGLRGSGASVRLFHSDLAFAEEEQSWAFEVDGPARLDLENAAGDVHIRAGEGGEVRVEAHKTAWDSSKGRAEQALAAMNVRVTQEGDMVTVRFVQKPDINIGTLHARPDTVDWSIYLPPGSIVRADTEHGEVHLAGTQGEADLKTHFGDVSVSDVGGALRVATESGKITAERVQAGEQDIHLDSGFGDITLEGVTAARLEVRTESGKIEVRDLDDFGESTISSHFGDILVDEGSGGSLTVETESGKVQLSNLDLAGALSVNSGFGEISLEGVSAASYALDSESGNIRVQGMSGAVQARSGFGGITILGASQATLDLETESGEIDFSGSLGRGPHRLESGFGDIRLALPADTALTFDLKTGFGRVQSGFEITLSGELDEKHWRGTINGGGASLEVMTESGGITLEVLAE